MLGYRRSTRPTHLGPYPLECLRRDPAILEIEAARSPTAVDPDPAPARGTLGAAARFYQDLFAGLRCPEPVAQRAPVPDALPRRSVDIKGGGYFLDASHVGICRLPGS